MAEENSVSPESSQQPTPTGQSGQPTQPVQPASSTQFAQPASYGQSASSTQPMPTAQPTPYQATYQSAAAGHAHGADGAPAAQARTSHAPGSQAQARASQTPPTARYGQGAHVSAAAPASTYSAGAQAKQSTAGKTFLVAFAGALVACVLAFGIASAFGVFGSGDFGSGSGNVSLGADTSTTINAQDTDATLAEAVAAKCLPSVAAIDVYANETSSYGMFGYGMSSNTGELTQSSLGSGVVLTADGYIITNYHVVEGGAAYQVTVEGETYDAELVGSDPSSDVAVLKINGVTDLTPIEIGDSDDLTIGEWVMSIGSPFGLEQSVATGIVSATSRSQIMSSSTDIYGNSTGSYTIYPNMIQTDAAINPGNSGGALVDANGKLIGINTLITSYSGNYSGVGFAIPVNYAVSLARQIIDGETPSHAQLGVSLSSINASIAKRYGFTVDSGAYVSAVSEGSGAETAGIQVGDIVVAFDGKAVESASDLMLDVRSKNAGDVVTVTVNRDGENQDIQVTLGSDSTQEASTQQNSSSLLDRLRGNSAGSSDAA